MFLAVLMIANSFPASSYATDASRSTSQQTSMVGELVSISPSASTYYVTPGGSYSFVNNSYFADRMVIVDVAEVNGTTYYQLNAAPGFSWKADSLGNMLLYDGIWVKASYTIHLVYCEVCKEYNCGKEHETTPSDPIEGETVSDKETGISVSGDLPANATIDAIDLTDKIELSEHYKMFDISIKDTSGNPWQPAVGTTVKVALPVTSGAESVTVIHFLEDPEQIQYAIAHGLGEVADVSEATDAEMEIISDAVLAYQIATGTTEMKVVGELFEDVTVVDGVATVDSHGFSCYVYWDGKYQALGEDWESLDMESSGTIYYVKPGESFRFETNKNNYNNLNSLWLIQSSDMTPSKITMEGVREGWILSYDYYVSFVVADDESLVGKTFTLNCQDANNKTVKFQVIPKNASTESMDSDNVYIAIYQGSGTPTNLFADLSNSDYDWYSSAGKVENNKTVYLGTTSGIIHKTVFNSSALVETQNGVSAFSDPDGRKTLAFAELNAGLQQDIIIKDGYPDYENYTMVIYGVKKVVSGSSTEWYVICKVLSKNDVQLIYNANIPDGFTGSSVLSKLPNNTVVTLGKYATVASVPDNLQFTEKINNTQYTVKFVGWSTDAGANPANRPATPVADDKWYEAGEQILLNANMELYAIWETDYTYNSANIEFNNHVLDTAGNVFSNLTGEFRYTVSSNFAGLKYTIYSGTGLATSKTGIFSSNNLSFTLVGEEYIVIENVPNNENDTYTITADRKPGHEIKQVLGQNGYAISENVCTFQITHTTNIAGEFIVDFENIVTSYTINYTTDNGTSLGNQSYTIYDAIALLAPTTEGYTFNGWKVTSSVGAWTANQQYAANNLNIQPGMYGNVTLVAQLTVNSYPFVFDTTVQGLTVADQYFEYGALVTQLNIPGNRPGYTFVGWEFEVEGTWMLVTDAQGNIRIPNGDDTYTTVYSMPAENVNLRARWVINQYVITWIVDGNVTTETYTYGATINQPADPTKAGYTFNGWGATVPTTMPAEDLTFTAQWTINQYTVTWIVDGQETTESYDYGETPAFKGSTAKPSDAQYSYTFTGWSPAIAPVTGDVTYTAQYSATINQYEVTFVPVIDVDNASALNKLTVAHGSTITLPTPDPVDEGFSFVRWEINGTQYQAGQVVTVSENMTFTAVWNPKPYVIEYVFSGVSNVTPPELQVHGGKYTDIITLRDIPTIVGHNFVSIVVVGKTTGNEYSITDHKVKLPAEDLVVTLTYQAISYTVTWIVDGTTTTETYIYGANINKLADPTKEGYTFAGWGADVPTTMPAEDLTFTAQWTINQYTISFNSNGGSAVNPITQNYGTQVTEPTTQRTGYTFGGWYTDAGLTQAYTFSTMPAAYIKLYAKWTVNQYTITFDSNGGSSVTSITQNYNTAVTAPTAPIKAGYVFGGWYTDVGLTQAYTFSTMPAANIKLYAKWTVNQYTITFNSNGGSAVNPITQNYGTQVTEPTTQRTGYTFGGWYTDAELTQAYTFSTMPAANITLYAKWSANTYTVVYNANGGVGSMSGSAHTYDAAKSLNANSFTKSGYTFAGWNTKADGSGTSYADNASVKNLTATAGGTVTLYAQWTIVRYTISFNSNGGSSVAAITQDYGTAVTKPSDPNKTGYTFVGWYQDQALTQAYTFSTMPATNITLYAKWTVNQYTITFNTAGGNEIASITQDYGTPVTAPDNPSKYGYNFVGWDRTIPSTMPAGNITITARWEIAETTLQLSVQNATGTFIFRVVGEGVDVIVTVEAGQTVTIGGLHVGKEYTITDLRWNWKYETIVLSPVEATYEVVTVTINNPKPSQYGWLGNESD